MRIRANKKILAVTVMVLATIAVAIVLTAFTKNDSATKIIDTYKSKWCSSCRKNMNCRA